MANIEIDAYTPAQMAARVEKAGIIKGNLDFLSTFILAVMAYVSKKVTFEKLMRNWAIVFAGNLAGSLAVVALVWLSRHWNAGAGAVGIKALMIANSKVNLTFMQALSRGVLCNMLVCLAVWLCFSGRSVTDKVLAIVFAITAFVALGFEHCVANMYFIPAGLLIKGDPQILAAAEKLLGHVPALSKLTAHGFVVNNLLPVTLGNIIGGSLLIAAIYWFVYLRQTAAEPVRRFMTEGPPTVPPDTSVAEAVQIMKRHTIGSVLVGEPGDAVGIVSESDVVRKVIAAGQKTKAVTVEKIMSTPLVSVDIKTLIYKSYRTMTDHRIRHLIIVENEQKVGFVSVKDLLKGPTV